MPAAAVKDDRIWSDCGEYYYDEAVAQAAVDFFPQHLRLTKGEWAGKPFHLEPWEAEQIIKPAFGWKRKDGTRRYRRVIVWVPRKNGKTELAAGVSHLALIGDGELGGEIYAIAKDKDQAEIVFNSATAMAAMSPSLSAELQLMKTAIYCPALNASFKPLTGRAEGKHGLNPSGIIGDEIHEWPDSKLYTFVHQGTAARRQPLEFLISTAGVRTGYGWELWQECQRIRAGEQDDPETLIVVFAAGEDDDWTDPKTWAKANPNLGISVKPEYLAAECARAQRSPRLENDFKRYHLNIWTEQATRFLPMDLWGKVSDRWKQAKFEKRLEGRRCFGGGDLSTNRDLTAYCLWFPPEKEGGKWVKLTRAFVPEDTVPDRVQYDRVPYDQWIRKGALHATPGNVQDYAFFKARLLEDAVRFNIEKFAIDRFLATQTAVDLRDEGLNVHLHGQGFLSMAAPTKEIERLCLGGLIDDGGHPVSHWCAGNMVVQTNPAGDFKPAKDKANERIDVTVADINALAAALSEDETPVTPELIQL
ncbi:MAG: terminase TerL endonuclease subunit [Pseudomonadota bacterium]